jgi:uncharacterized protein (DUF433 family)
MEVVEYFLEDESFEDFLERFDLTPVEVIIKLYDIGLIQDEILEELQPS